MHLRLFIQILWLGHFVQNLFGTEADPLFLGTARFREIGTLHPEVTFEHIHVHTEFRGLQRDIAGTIAIGRKLIADMRITHAQDSTAQERIRLTEQFIEQSYKDVYGSFEEVGAFYKALSAREKRNLLDTIGNIISVGSSLFSTYETKNVANKALKIEKLAHKNAFDVKALKDSMQSVIDFLDHTLEYNIRVNEYQMQCNYFERFLKTLSEGLYALLYNRLSPGIIGQKALLELFAEIQVRANQRGLSPVTQNPHSIFALPVSHVLSTHKILCLIHVPLIKANSTPMTLFRQEHTYVSHENQTVRLSGKRKLIAVNPSNHQFIPFTTDELKQQCYRKKDTYYCHRLQAQYKIPRDCISALYMYDHDLSLQLCKKSLVPKDEVIIHNKGNIFAIDPSLKVESKCSLAAVANAKVFQIAPGKYKVPKGCSLSTNLYEINSLPEYSNLHVVTENKRVNFSLNEFLPTLSYMDRKKIQSQEPVLEEIEAYTPFYIDAVIIVFFVFFLVLSGISCLTCAYVYQGKKSDEYSLPANGSPYQAYLDRYPYLAAEHVGRATANIPASV